MGSSVPCPKCGEQSPSEAKFCGKCGSQLVQPGPHSGDIIADRYRIVECIGKGAMGTVYRAEHVQLGKPMAIKLLHRDHGFINLEQPIPLTLSAFGEKTLAYCGAECDAHLTWNPTVESLTANRAILDASARKAGRDPATIPSKAIFPLALLRPGETAASPRVLHSLGPFITNLLHVLCEWDDALLPGDDSIAPLVQRYRDYLHVLPPERRHLILHEGHLVYTRPDERDYLVPEMAQIAGLIGDPDQVIENILPPRLLGKLTGLNPIVMLFSVMVGATLAGFYGIITAVPIAATIKELFLAKDRNPVFSLPEDTAAGPPAERSGSVSA